MGKKANFRKSCKNFKMVKEDDIGENKVRR